MKTLFLSILMIFSFSNTSYCNNIAVENVSLVNQNAVDNYTWIKFDLSWENSWRTSSNPQNWDAAWVFAKVRVNSGNWRHARIHYEDGINDGHSGPAGVTINTTDDEVGTFIYRSEDGTGDVNWENIHLRWDYGDNNVGDEDLIDIQVFAYEMVYVPEGEFRLGGTFGSEAGKFYSSPFGWVSYLVQSENAISIGTNNGNLRYQMPGGGPNPGDMLGPLPADFPKGFNAFYCMKYEITQGQWVDFFNTLTPTQKANRDITGPDGKSVDTEVSRNGVSWSDGSSAASTTLPNVPLNYVSCANLLAFFDWCGLRPLTELEYEKSCRGPVNPVADGFAWGNANIHSSDYSYSNLATSAENISSIGELTGNALYRDTDGAPAGPKRVGILASSAINKSREETGASYYGIMELSGNLYERVISVGNPEGRSFDGRHGNGILAFNGNSNVSNWPNFNAGFGYRGGSFFNGSDFIRVSDRYDAATTLTGSNNRLGGRGVRTAQN